MSLFWDVNVPWPTNKNVQKDMLTTALKMGWDGICWTHTVKDRLKPSDACKITPLPLEDAHLPFTAQTELLRVTKPALPSVPTVSGDTSAASSSSSSDGGNSGNSKKPRSGFQQRTRITINVEDGQQLNAIVANQVVLKSYDLVAVRPSDEKLFHACCQWVDCDIISLELSRKLDFFVKLPHVGMAKERKIVFEVCYAPAIRDASSRRWLIANTMNLLHMTRGKHVIISSEAAKAMELRGPYDVINLACMMGFKPDAAKAAISTLAHSALLRGFTRKTMKAVLLVQPLESKEGKEAKQQQQPQQQQQTEKKEEKEKPKEPAGKKRRLDAKGAAVETSSAPSSSSSSSSAAGAADSSALSAAAPAPGTTPAKGKGQQQQQQQKPKQEAKQQQQQQQQQGLSKRQQKKLAQEQKRLERAKAAAAASAAAAAVATSPAPASSSSSSAPSGPSGEGQASGSEKTVRFAMDTSGD